MDGMGTCQSQTNRVRSMVNEVTYLYETFGNADYIGENISQIEHALQAGLIAEKKGYDSEVVIAALIHDLGHLIGLQTKSRNLTAFGEMNHENIGAIWLEFRGWPKCITNLVRNHVDAKRYLLFSDPKYIENLSEASLETLKLQGGPMNESEAKKFLSDPRSDSYIKMRKIDDLAKVPNYFQSPEDVKHKWSYFHSKMFDFLIHH